MKSNKNSKKLDDRENTTPSSPTPVASSTSSTRAARGWTPAELAERARENLRMMKEAFDPERFKNDPDPGFNPPDKKLP